jgi:hypothetical protein
MNRPSFRQFYQNHYITEYRHPANVALHIFGTVGGLAFVAWALASPMPWLAILTPIMHAAPGLAGHRLFERSAAVGDVRVSRKDFPVWWFIVANH